MANAIIASSASASDNTAAPVTPQDHHLTFHNVYGEPFSENNPPPTDLCLGTYGKIWRYRSTHKQVPCNHSLTDVQKCVSSLTKDTVAVPYNPEDDVPYDSLQDFTVTLRNSCGPTSPFKWPTEQMNFSKAIAVAVHHLPPGHMVLIKNGLPLPKEMRKDDGKQEEEAKAEKHTEDWKDTWWSQGWWTGSQSAESWKESSAASAEDDWRSPNEDRNIEAAEGLQGFYHGTHVGALPSILEEGFKPSLGAGSDALLAHYGVPVPGCHVAHSWKEASTYPMGETTGKVEIPEQKTEKRHQWWHLGGL